jgi:hypothetical protein
MSLKQIQGTTIIKRDNTFVSKISKVRIPARKAVGNVTFYSVPVTASEKSSVGLCFLPYFPDIDVFQKRK